MPITLISTTINTGNTLSIIPNSTTASSTPMSVAPTSTIISTSTGRPSTTSTSTLTSSTNSFLKNNSIFDDKDFSDVNFTTNGVSSSVSYVTSAMTTSTNPTFTCETNATPSETPKKRKGVKVCTDEKIGNVGRIVFGEARGEIAKGQLAVAWTVVNRVNHAGYPNTLNEVVFQKYGSNYQYNTLDDKAHTSAWKQAKSKNSATYKNAIAAARAAMCKKQDDPTGCATDFCSKDPCRATNDNKFYKAYNKIQIGSHWFVCRRAVAG